MPEIGLDVITHALSNNLFSRLKELSFVNNPRMQERLPGMRSALRAVTPKDLHDMTRHHEIDVRTFEDGSLEGKVATKRQLEHFSKHGVEKGSMMFTVSGSPAHSKLPEREIGELQGWICFYQDEPERVARAQQAGFLPTRKNTSLPVVEISYGKYGKAEKQQMKDGLLQALTKLSEATAMVTHQKINEPALTVTAYASPHNTASRSMLVGAGFEQRGSLQYNPEKPDDVPDTLYVLNWQNYNSIMRERATEELVATGKGMLVGQSGT